MAIPVGKVLPTAVVAAMVGYCCWPHVFGPSHAPIVGEAGNRPEIATALLSPGFEPAPKRDPFQTRSVTQKVASEADEDDEADTPTATAAQKQAHTPAASFILTGTFVHGNLRAALINGQLYTLGEQLGTPGAPTDPYVIVRIDPDRVLIDHRGQTVELNYSTFVSKSESSPRAAGTSQTLNPDGTATKRPVGKRAVSVPSPKYHSNVRKTSASQQRHE